MEEAAAVGVYGERPLCQRYEVGIVANPSFARDSVIVPVQVAAVARLAPIVWVAVTVGPETGLALIH